VPRKYESFKTLTIVRAVPSASIAPFTVTFMPLLLPPVAPSARLIAAAGVKAVLNGVAAIAAPAAAALTPPPADVEPDPLDTVGTLIVGTLLVADTFGTETVGMFIDGADICETLGKNGTEL
jgi:hypothetical protein